ncbi:MAG TPA: IS30 family transposase, partial [Candidatus Nanoarchaeia archaeon]|nr:IS30 family transposase [Candidatus Nanoarchaeia archaeon]
QEKFKERSKIPKKPKKLDTNPDLKNFVFKHVRLCWSPEQIAHELKELYPEDKHMQISHESIYTYIYVLPRGGLKKELIACLRQRRKARGKTKNIYQKSEKITDMLSIDERPKEVEDRIVPGHWEGDLIIGKNQKTALGTLVERTTRFTMLVPLKARDSWEVYKSFAKMVKKIPQELARSLTYDRGTEMRQHKLFTRDTNVKVYFAHPYSPWERGTNENTNGLIRQFFPKKTDFSKVTLKEIKRAQDLLNGRPRKVLGWKKPNEVFQELIALEI